MSTQDSFAPDPISTLILAMYRSWRCRPEKWLESVQHLIGRKSYGFLDAVATLCTFAPQCDAAAIVMGCERNDGQLYIAVKPIASPELQIFVPQLLDLMKSVPHTPSTLLDVSQGFDLETLRSLETATTDHQIIITVYRACHTKFCASVRGEGGCRQLLAALPKRGEMGFQDEWETLSAKLDYIINIMSRDVEELSDADYVGLHYTAAYVLGFTMLKRAILPSVVSSAMKRLEPVPRAVRTILATARKEGVARQWDVHWIASSTTQNFRASVDEDYIRNNFGVVADSEEIIVYPPPKTLAKDPTSQCVAGVAHMHPEAALLGYLRQHKVDVSGYIGASPPVCYPCVMLLYSLNAEVRAKLSDEERQRRVLGRVGVSRCSFRIDIPWCPPPTMDDDVLKTFKAALVEDYATIVHVQTVKERLHRSLLDRVIPPGDVKIVLDGGGCRF